MLTFKLQGNVTQTAPTTQGQPTFTQHNAFIVNILRRLSVTLQRATQISTPRIALCWFLAVSATAAHAATITSIRVSKDNPSLGVIGGVVYCDIGETWNGSLPADKTAGMYLWRIKGSLILAPGLGRNRMVPNSCEQIASSIHKRLGGVKSETTVQKPRKSVRK